MKCPAIRSRKISITRNMLTTYLNSLGIDIGRYNPALLLEPNSAIPSELPLKTQNKISAIRNIIREYEQSKNTKPSVIHNAKDVYDLLSASFRNLTHEEVHVVFLRKDNKVINVKRLSTGTGQAILLDSHDILREALNQRAASIVIVHNHPSGNCLPSSNDIEQTQKLARTLKVLDVSLVDHLIVSETSFYSFADEKITHLNLQKN